MQDKQLQKNILFTVAYFGSFGYALTAFELWRHLFSQDKSGVKFDLEEILQAIGKEPLSSKLVKKKGFITLKNDEHLIEKRLKNQKFSLSNIRKIRRWVKFFSAIPYIRGVFLTGTLSMKNAERKSDWDIFVVLAKDRIWAGRFLLSTFLHLVGKRRHKDKIKERFCLNHYVTENGLILDEHNEFCSNFVSFSLPVLNEELHRKYLGMNEQWICFQKPNYDKEEVLNRTLAVEKGFERTREVLEFFLEKSRLGGFLNNLSKKLMINRIRNNTETYYKDADIRYNDLALVFLPKPHRIEVLQKTLEKLTKCS